MTGETVWLSETDPTFRHDVRSRTYRQYVDEFVGDGCSAVVLPADTGASSPVPSDIIVFGSDFGLQGGIHRFDVAAKVAVAETAPEFVREIEPQKTDGEWQVVLLRDSVNLSLDPEELADFSTGDGSAAGSPQVSAVYTSRSPREGTDGHREAVHKDAGDSVGEVAESIEQSISVRSIERPGRLTRLRDIDPTVRESIEQKWDTFWRYIQVRGYLTDEVRKPKNEIRGGYPKIFTGPCHLGKARYVRANADDPGNRQKQVAEVFLDETYTYESFVERIGPDGTIQDGILKRVNRRAKQKDREIVLLLHNLHTVDIEDLFGETLTTLSQERYYSPRHDVMSFQRQSVTPRLRYSHEPFEFAGHEYLNIVGLFDTLDADCTRHSLPPTVTNVFNVEQLRPDEDIVYLLCGLGEGDPVEAIENDTRYSGKVWLTEALKSVNHWLDEEEVEEIYRVGYDAVLSIDEAHDAWYGTYLPFVESLVEELDVSDDGPLESCETFDNDVTISKNDRFFSFRRDMHAITGIEPPNLKLNRD